MIKIIIILALLSRCILSQTIDLPDDIDIKSSHIGIVELPERVHSRWKREGFIKYTKVIAPNNGAIHIVAQKVRILLKKYDFMSYNESKNVIFLR